MAMVVAAAFLIAVVVFAWLAILTKLVLDSRNAPGTPLDQEKIRQILDQVDRNKARMKTALADHQSTSTKES